ncbi:NUDIX domain-containing protein [Microbacterium dextranolyticum]|uniref:ADP-ribose pyrophosphatase n=1 Tax=Microbacterium dextranolyticum TaxID=36806 RepID=A0A9W6M5R5_9MICO|nr:NUDIX hydrolase [Microbacterium dextranolyticum]MBM7464020.1 8-oxo-dGTP pyrophosphatase MutT (NUDIX family) [Microbacterium dextranolyticum]GLJ95101.1 ADP-ribose pyrophosphatase [Microbacterium dextranolyticum]
MTWKTRASRTVYDNRWIRVDEHEVTGPHGDGIYGVVEMQQPAVFVVALDDDERVCLITLERYTTGLSIEVPAGGSDGEEPLVAAQRELAEETGLAAREWTLLGRMNALNGIARAPEYVFLARGVEHWAEASAASRDEEGIESVRWVAFDEALTMISDGRITDGETIAALAYAGIRLGRFA